MIKKSPIHKIWRKHKERIDSWKSELITFKVKWLRNYWKTDLTWKYYPLDHVQSFQFAHALPKWLYPEYRNNPNNIVFVDSIEQHEWLDKTTAWKKAIVEALVMKWELIPRLKEKWEDFLIKQRQWNIH